MTRVILCRAGEAPYVIWLSSHEALLGVVGGPVVCLALYGGVELWCNRDGLLFGLTLTRRVVAISRTADWRVGALWLHVAGLTVDVGEEVWRANGDFVLARSGSDGKLADLTEPDITHWMFWLSHD
jgi:hypothetical protein